MGKINKHYLEIFVSPAAIILVLCLSCVLASLFFTQQVWAYNSDDVSWQTILLTWRPSAGHVAYLGVKDNFLINLPFFWLFGHLFRTTRTALLIEACVFAVLNFTLFYIACLYFLKKCGIALTYGALLPFLWLATFGFGLEKLFLNTDWRNFEMGFSFIYFALAAKLYFGEINPTASRFSKLLMLLAAFVAGVFSYSDPYFLYFTVVPIVLFYLALYALKKTSRRLMLLVIGNAILALCFARAMRFLVARIGLQTPGPALSLPKFTILHNLLPSVANTFNGLLTIFGADSLGKHALGPVAISAACNLLVIIFIGYCLYRSLPARETAARTAIITPYQFAFGLFGGLVLFVCLVYTLTDNMTAYDYRYLLIAVFACTLLLTLGLNSLEKGRGLMLSLVGAALIFNVASSFYGANHAVAAALPTALPNADNYQLIATIQKLGLNKGYTGYWDGNINTYLAGGAVNFLPVTCVSQQTRPLNLLVDGTLFQQQAKKTFYVLDPNTNPLPSTCTEQQLISQFGPPEQIKTVDRETILIYDYDLGSKMP